MKNIFCRKKNERKEKKLPKWRYLNSLNFPRGGSTSPQPVRSSSSREGGKTIGRRERGLYAPRSVRRFPIPAGKTYWNYVAFLYPNSWEFNMYKHIIIIIIITTTTTTNNNNNNNNNTRCLTSTHPMKQKIKRIHNNYKWIAHAQILKILEMSGISSILLNEKSRTESFFNREISLGRDESLFTDYDWR